MEQKENNNKFENDRFFSRLTIEIVFLTWSIMDSTNPIVGPFVEEEIELVEFDSDYR